MTWHLVWDLGTLSANVCAKAPPTSGGGCLQRDRATPPLPSLCSSPGALCAAGGPAESRGALTPRRAPAAWSSPPPPPAPSLSGIALNCRRESTHCPGSSASRSYLSALSPELFLLIIPRCWWVRPAPASCGQLPGVQAHPEPGARPAPALWCWHRPLLLPSARGSVLALACLEPPHAQR